MLSGLFGTLISLGAIITLIVVAVIWGLISVFSSNEFKHDKPTIEPIRMEITINKGQKDTIYIYKKY